MTDFEIQRRYPRVDADNVVLVKRLDGEPVEGFTKTRVMGQGGCMLVSDEPLGVDARLEVLLSFSGRVVKAHGRVVYEIPRKTDEIEVGVEFVDLSTADRDFLQQVLPGPL